jgi:hypothetical protein
MVNVGVGKWWIEMGSTYICDVCGEVHPYYSSKKGEAHYKKGGDKESQYILTEVHCETCSKPHLLKKQGTKFTFRNFRFWLYKDLHWECFKNNECVKCKSPIIKNNNRFDDLMDRVIDEQTGGICIQAL